jgi:DNA-binding TFAR19-related protein (PDSD5 family)
MDFSLMEIFVARYHNDYKIRQEKLIQLQQQQQEKLEQKRQEEQRQVWRPTAQLCANY